MLRSDRFTPPRRTIRTAAAILIAAATLSPAQAQPARVEMRLVPQTGTPPDCVRDDTTFPTRVSQGIFKRIEAQFRIIDLDLTDQLVPAGLTTMMVDIKLFPPEAGTLDRALLSRFETAQAGSTPPASVDCSGLPTNAFGASTGIHRPYRGGIGPPAPGNNNPVNGTLGPGQINGNVTLTGSGGRIFNNGETCVAAKRFVVVDAIYDTFVDAFVAQLQTVKMGDPNDKATGLGPMARQDLRDDLHEQVRSSIDAGAKLTMGGEIPDRPGFFYPVTVLENVQPGMPAYDDELFGPVASIIRVADDNEAMRVANDSRFGLGGGIISKNVEKAIAMATNEFDTGMININGYNLANPQLPFGGVKESGYGREHGGFGRKEFVNVKSIQVTEVSP